VVAAGNDELISKRQFV